MIWKILKHVKSFTPANGQCTLCNAEKDIIILKPEFTTLNTKTNQEPIASIKNLNYYSKNENYGQDLD